MREPFDGDSIRDKLLVSVGVELSEVLWEVEFLECNKDKDRDGDGLLILAVEEIVGVFDGLFLLLLFVGGRGKV